MYQRGVVLHAPLGRSLPCRRAKRLLKRAGYHFEVLEAAGDPPSGVRKRLAYGRSYRNTVPYLFVGDRPVGGLAEMRALSVTGILEHVVRGNV
jgi:glutaredoxin